MLLSFPAAAYFNEKNRSSTLIKFWHLCGNFCLFVLLWASGYHMHCSLTRPTVIDSKTVKLSNGLQTNLPLTKAFTPVTCSGLSRDKDGFSGSLLKSDSLALSKNLVKVSHSFGRSVRHFRLFSVTTFWWTCTVVASLYFQTLFVRHGRNM